MNSHLEHPALDGHPCPVPGDWHPAPPPAQPGKEAAAPARPGGRDCGVIVVNTGNGKGKSSSAYGMAVRALGHGMKVGIVQFTRAAQPTGEERFFRRFPQDVRLHVLGDGDAPQAPHAAQVRTAREVARRMLRDPELGLVLLDEFTTALRAGLLGGQQAIVDLLARPERQHVVITGPDAPPALLAVAHTVTDMGRLKHAFLQGIRAQPGIEM